MLDTACICRCHDAFCLDCGCWHRPRKDRMTTIEIDLNVRTVHNWTYSGLEDCTGPVTVGDTVRVLEPESGVSGQGYVRRIDQDQRLVFVEVDWSALCPTA